MKFNILDAIKYSYSKACSVEMPNELEIQIQNLLILSDIEELDGLKPHEPPFGNPYENGTLTLSFYNRLEQELKLDIHQKEDNSFSICIHGKDRNPFSITLLNNGKDINIIFASDSDLIDIHAQKGETNGNYYGKIEIYTNIILEEGIPGRAKGFYNSNNTPQNLVYDAVYVFSLEERKINNLEGSIVKNKSFFLKNDADGSFDIIDVPKETSIYNLLKYIGRLFQEAYKETINPKRKS